MFSLRFLCRPIYVLTCSKVRFYFTKIMIIVNILNPFFHPHSHTPVKILLNVRWQHEAELGRVPCWKKQCRSRKPSLGDIFFFHFFNLLIFVSLEMFTIHVLRSYEKMEWIYLNQGENMGVSHYYVFALLVSRIYFSDIYINAKYK